jgi:hypothetical protein
MIAIIPEPVIGIPGTLIGIVRNPQKARIRAEIALFGNNCAPTVLQLNLGSSILVHFQTSILRLPVLERAFTDTDPAAQVLHRGAGLRFFQHPTICSALKRLLFHDASPPVVLYPEKLSFAGTKFLGSRSYVTKRRHRKRS